MNTDNLFAWQVLIKSLLCVVFVMILASTWYMVPGFCYCHVVNFHYSAAVCRRCNIYSQDVTMLSC